MFELIKLIKLIRPENRNELIDLFQNSNEEMEELGFTKETWLIEMMEAHFAIEVEKGQNLKKVIDAIYNPEKLKSSIRFLNLREM